MIIHDIDREESYQRLLHTLETGSFKEETEYNPLMIAFEITTRCNLHCIRCERRAITPLHLNKDMDEAVFERLTPLFRYVRGVSIVGGLGEPLLAKKFWNYLVRMKQDKCQVMYFTNGTLLTDDVIKKTFAHDVDAVAFSIDSLSKSIYERLKTGGNFQYSVERINSFLRLRRETGAKTRLMLNCAVQRDTLDGMIPLIDFAAEHEIDRLWFTGVITHVPSEVPNSHLTMRLEDLTDIFDEVREKAKKAGVDIRLPETKIDGRQICKDLWTNLYIFYNGDICACPHFREEKTYFFHVLQNAVVQESRLLPSTILGNALTDNVLELWNGEQHKIMRSAMLSGSPQAPCLGCHFSYDLH